MNNFKAKKLLALLSSAAMIAGALPSVTSAVQAAETKETSTLLGDANDDGKVTVADAVTILQFIANKDKYNLTGQLLDNADVYNRGDGVTARDALTIQRLDARVIDSLPEGVMETPTTTTSTDVKPVADITYIHLKGDTAEIIGDHAAVNGSVVTIDHSGTFYIDGTLNDGQINVNIADEVADPETVKIFLNGAKITGKSAPAILITNAENTSINLVDGTENTITDGDTAYAGDYLGAAVIEAKDDLTIKGGELGTGVLNLTANTQEGIFCNNDLKFNGGVVNIKTLNADGETSGVKGKTSVSIKDGTLNIDAEGDGIKSGKGNVAVSGGSVSIKAGNDAVQADTTIDISGGTVIAGGDRGFTATTGVNITGGTVYATATDNQVDTALLSGSTQTVALLNCIDDATNEKDGMWKKANTIASSKDSKVEFTKKYKYVLISDSSINGAKSCSFYNIGTGAQVTHTDGKQTQFQLSNISVFENVDPSGGSSATVTPTPTTDSLTITLNGANIETNAPTDTVSVSNGVLTIKKAATFAVSGEGKGSQIVVDVDKNAYPDAVVELDLMGMSLTNETTAPIFVNSIGDEVQIVAKAGTVNTISDGTTHSQTYTDSDGNTNTVEGAIFSRDDIKFKGTGTLTVNGNQDDAIVCKNDIKIYNGTINVNAADDGIRGKDSVTVGDSTKSDGSAADNSKLKLTVKTKQGDGIKSTATDTATDKAYGVVTINGGTIDISSYLDGIQAEQEFIMNGGDLNIYTYEGSTYTAPAATQQPGQGGRGGWTGGWNPGGGFAGFDSGHDLGLEFSCKAIKAGEGNITVNNGSINIDSTDDAVHCAGKMDINGGKIIVKTADDALHCDKYLNINDGIIKITDCYEGLEAMQIRIKGGDITVYGFDDPINAGEKGAAKTIDVSNDNCLLQIDGGIIRAYVTNNREGDALDSNGKIIINGGEIYAEGSVDGPDSALDSDGEMIVNGGLVVATGGLGRGELPEQSSKQNSLYWGNSRTSYNAGSVVALKDANGNELISYTSEQALKCAVISSSDIKTGGKYSIYVNGNVVAEFTVSSALTTQGDIGSSMGGGFSW